MMSELVRLSQRMMKLASKVDEFANQKVIAATTKFAEIVIDRTPIDKGFAVSNWSSAFNYNPRSVRPAYSPGNKGSTAAANRAASKANTIPKLKNRKTGQTVSIINNAPHISRLNAGYSGQAPAGFIETARAEAVAAALQVKFER